MAEYTWRNLANSAQIGVCEYSPTGGYTTTFVDPSNCQKQGYPSPTTIDLWPYQTPGPDKTDNVKCCNDTQTITECMADNNPVIKNAIRWLDGSSTVGPSKTICDPDSTDPNVQGYLLKATTKFCAASENNFSDLPYYEA